MTGIGIILTALTFIVIIFRIKAEVDRNRLSTKGGIMVGIAAALSLITISSVALLTSEDSLLTRFSVLGICIAFVFLSHRFSKRLN